MPSRAPQRINFVILRVPRLGTVAGRLHRILCNAQLSPVFSIPSYKVEAHKYTVLCRAPVRALGSSLEA